MSLRMRRAAAGSAPNKIEVPLAGQRVAVRLAGQLFELLPGTRATAGRAPECELVLGDRLCSRRHAELSRAEDGSVTVRDLESSNGTYVNGIRLAAPRRVSLGDWITIGNETFELCLAADEERQATPTIPVGPNKNRGARDGAAIGSKTKTDPGSPLLSLASFTAMASSRTPTPIEPDLMRRPLEVLLRQAESGQALDPAAPAMAAMLALRMASVTRDAHWLSYCFRLYAALRLPLSPDLIDRVREALPSVPQPEAAPFDAYLKMLEESLASAPDPDRQQLLVQLDELRSAFA